MNNNKENLKSKWAKTASQLLVGYTIIDVVYPTETGFYSQPPCLVLQKNNEEVVVVPQSDDEGNDGGALYINNLTTNNTQLLPTI